MTPLDLTFERTIDVPKAAVWRAWTQPALLMQWFCPLPWRVTECDIELFAGGMFRTTMVSPEGLRVPNLGTYLEVVPQDRLVWTNALGPGFRPATARLDVTGPPHFFFTAKIELRDAEQGTHYRATVLHGNEVDCQQHAAMGFEQGWGIALDQMVTMIKRGI